MTELRKRAMTWLQSCQTQTPTIEEVERLIQEITDEFYSEGSDIWDAEGLMYEPAVKAVKCQHEPGNLRTLTIPPKTQCKHCGEYY